MNIFSTANIWKTQTTSTWRSTSSPNSNRSTHTATLPKVKCWTPRENLGEPQKATTWPRKSQSGWAPTLRSSLTIGKFSKVSKAVEVNSLFSVSPLFASQDLMENAPETYIYASELDIFANDAVMLSKRMTEAGVKELGQIISVLFYWNVEVWFWDLVYVQPWAEIRPSIVGISPVFSPFDQQKDPLGNGKNGNA